jgi:adenosylcobinamide-GDP ribazoletransferase
LTASGNQHRVPAIVAALPAAVEFLTPLRIHPGGPLADDAVGRSSAYFPLVGLLLGLALIGLDRILSVLLPVAVASGLLVAFLAAATGSLHMDGLADTVDALGAGRTRERRLEVMRDSHIGAFGAVALAILILLQWLALASLVPPWRSPALLVFPMLGRAAMVAAIAAFPYARSEGLGVLFRAHIWPWPAPVAAAVSLAVTIVYFGATGVALWGASLLSAALMGAFFSQRLGGLTGDTYGAICEVSQIVVLLLIVSGHQAGWLGIGAVRQ